MIVELGIGHGSKVDVPERTVRLPQILQALRDFLTAEGFSILDGKQAAQRLGVFDCLVVLETDAGQAILVTFFDRHRDINCLARPLLH